MGIMLLSLRTLLVAVALATFATHTEAMQAVPGQVGRPFNELTKGIYPLAESGHPSILSRNFGQSLWATFRMKTILRLQSNLLWDTLIAQGLQAAPVVTVESIDGIGGLTNIPHPPIDANTVFEQGFQTLLAFLVPGAWMAFLMKSTETENR
jgi:hypothetical protein